MEWSSERWWASLEPEAELSDMEECYDCNTKSTPVPPITLVTSPDLISYSGSSS